MPAPTAPTARLIAGVQPVREALRTPDTRVQRVLVLAGHGGPSSPTLQGIARLAQSRQVPTEFVDQGALDRLAKGVVHQGVLALAEELTIWELSELLALKPTLITVLDRISDPHNFGAIVRSSVALGVDGIVWPEHDSAPLTPATFRSSAGAVEHARLCRVRSLSKALTEMHEAGMQVVGLADEAAEPLEQVDLTVPTVLVVGSEGFGMKKGIRACCQVLAKLCTQPPIQALNASVAAGVAIYEARRQRLMASAKAPNAEG